MDENMLLNLALDAGEIMILCGAETHRVEDTMERILSVKENNMPEAFVTPTGIFAGVQGTLTGSRTKFKRITSRSINLEKITRVNSLSRKFVSGKLSMEAAFEELARIHALKDYPVPLTTFCHGIVSAAFVQMFNGTLLDALAAFVIGILIGTIKSVMAKHKISSFLISLFGGGIIAFCSVLFFAIGFGTHYEHIIIGTLMLLVPGVALTNAVRDIMSGDFLSGTSLILEAIITAVAIASGVGTVLSIYSMIVGGV